MKLFYYLDEAGSAVGPITPRLLREELRAGKLNSSTLVVRCGDEDWLPLSVWEDELEAQPEPVTAQRAARAQVSSGGDDFSDASGIGFARAAAGGPAALPGAALLPDWIT